MNHDIRRRQVDSRSTGFQGNKEHRNLIRGKRLHHPAAFFLRGRADQKMGRNALL